MKKSTLKITNLTCANCTMSIDTKLEETTGILSAKTNYHRSQSIIEYDESIITEEEICTIIRNAGYEVVKISE